MSEANLAWIAWREHRLSEAQEHGHTALTIWQQTPLVYPFYLAALFPLIAVALARHQIVEAVSHARALLAPEQRRLPAALTAALQAAIQEAGQPETARAHLEQALALAQEIGYL